MTQKQRIGHRFRNWFRKKGTQIRTFRLPRSWQVILFLLAIAATAYLIWLLLGAKALTAQWAFRRAEKQLLVGPSEILGAFEVKRSADSDYQYRYLVGETEEGLLICNISGSWYQGYSADLDYREKTGDITLVPVNESWGRVSPYDDGEMSYFLAMTDLPGAAYGELDVTAQNEQDEPMEKWSMAAEFEDGYFLFGTENIWNYSVRAIAGSMVSVAETAYTLCVYDSQGELLGQRSWSLSQAQEAWNAQVQQEMEEAGYRVAQDAPETE